MYTRVSRATALPALVALLAACQTTQPLVNRAREEQRIRDLSGQMRIAMQAKNADTLATFYAPDALYLYPNGPMVRGTDAIRGAFAQMFALPNVAASISPMKIEVAESGELAYETGTYRFAADMPAGRLDDVGKYVTIWKHIAGHWRIAADISNSDRPLAQLAAVLMPATQVAAGAIAVQTPVAGAPVHAHTRELVWGDAPPSLPKGAQIAVLQGDPMQPGPFTIRLKVPANFRIPPHFHPVAEHVTVISGSASFGHGERWDDTQLKRLEAGDFIQLPTGLRHFVIAHNETVVQVNSTGPFTITYVNPQDDPRGR